MTIYTLPEPFKTRHDRHGVDLFVVAYNDKTGRFTYCFDESVLDGSARAEDLNPPPPIPAAARKPRVGEVWAITDIGHFGLLLAPSPGNENLWHVVNSHYAQCLLKPLYPATPEEAAPFRPLLDGLMRSLGESHD